MNRAALFSIIALALLAGCVQDSGCPKQEDSVLCGLCEQTNRCHYCDAGQTCSGDVCGEYRCTSPRVETTLFRFVGGQLAPENTPATLSNGEIGFSYDAWFVIVLEDGTEAAEGYAYSLEDPENAPLPPGLTLAEDGHLAGLPATQGDYTFTVCATSPTGVESCREATMTVRMPQMPSASPTHTPSATPTAEPGFIFDGIWQGPTRLYMHGPAESFPEGCNMLMWYTFWLETTPTSNEIAGEAEATVLEVNGCEPVMSPAFVGTTSSSAISNVVMLNDQSATFSTGQTDFIVGVVPGRGIEVFVETCQSPDPRCTCDSPDPRCPAEEMLPGQWTDVHQETINWWEGEGWAVENYTIPSN